MNLQGNQEVPTIQISESPETAVARTNPQEITELLDRYSYRAHEVNLTRLHLEHDVMHREQSVRLRQIELDHEFRLAQLSSDSLKTKRELRRDLYGMGANIAMTYASRLNPDNDNGIDVVIEPEVVTRRAGFFGRLLGGDDEYGMVISIRKR